ncbi:MAG: thiol reductant ABC exporter subunit CydC [Lactobacillus kefiranofaciens]|nr:Thiol reductant ABC exporter, CydC subunit [Lactobacillus kefiranofaciens subsp. kefiranofaciens]
MNQVIFLENGQVAMQGSPAELWQTSSRYRELKKADQGL